MFDKREMLEVVRSEINGFCRSVRVEVRENPQTGGWDVYADRQKAAIFRRADVARMFEPPQAASTSTAMAAVAILLATGRVLPDTPRLTQEAQQVCCALGNKIREWLGSERFKCKDCGHQATGRNDYMVHNFVWDAAHVTGGGAKTGHLCLECLQRRVGRPLTIEDFTHSVDGRAIMEFLSTGRNADV